jgi:hypothetical protein
MYLQLGNPKLGLVHSIEVIQRETCPRFPIANAGRDLWVIENHGR